MYILCSQAELAVLKDHKTAMLALNISTNRLCIDFGDLVAGFRDGVADIYQIWDETFQM